MLRNRSAPCDSLMPHLLYDDVGRAIAWLNAAFGFSEYYRYVEPDGTVSNGQMFLGKAWVMLGAKGAAASAVAGGRRPMSVVVFVEDVDAHCERARAAGARILSPPRDGVFGERQYEVEDVEGHQWFFSQHVRDVAPEDWGATVARG